MMQRTGAGPLIRRALIVDSALAGATNAAARSVHALVTELRARNIDVVEAMSFEDGLATVVSDSGIHCILLNWTQGQQRSQQSCTGDRRITRGAETQQQGAHFSDGQPRPCRHGQR